MSASAGLNKATNWFGFATAKTAPTDSKESATQSVVEAVDDNGDTIAVDVYGGEASPECTLQLKSDLAASDWTGFELGTVFAASSGGLSYPVMLRQAVVTTGAGADPTVALSAWRVETGAATGRKFAAGVGAVSALRKAQLLGTPWTATGSDCYLQSCTLTATVEGGPKLVNGSPVASSCHNGRVEVTADYLCAAGTLPTVTASSGWTVTQSPSAEDADGSYTKCTVTAVKPITATEPSGS